ncbi:MAG: hypothetical protein ABIZ49_09590, partial [Opitutaceae bacterium]
NHGFPKLFSAARDGADARSLWRETNRTVVVVLIGSQISLLALAWISPWLIGPVIDARYTGSLDWLLPTGGAALAATTTPFYHNLLLARNREGDCLKLSLLSAAFRLGAMAIACAVSASAFRVVLIALPWLTVALEGWYVGRRVLRNGVSA